MMCKAKFAQAIDKAIMPGMQGGPHNQTTAAIAVAFKEASQPAFKEYAAQIVKNAKALADQLLKHGFRLITGGTDNHLILFETFKSKGILGRDASRALDRAGIVANCNLVPFDTQTPMNPSGVRIGTPSVTSRGMKEAEMVKIGDWINAVLTNAKDEAVLDRIAGEIAEFCKSFICPGMDPRNWADDASHSAKNAEKQVAMSRL